MVQTNNKERVVVGVDGSPQSVAALRWALAHAQAGTVVEAVMAWEVPPSYGVKTWVRRPLSSSRQSWRGPPARTAG